MMRSVVTLITLLASLPLGACGPMGRFMSKNNPQVLRKEKNEQLLKSLGVPVNQHLPLVESESEAKFRSRQDTARRALVLYIVVLAAHKAIATDPADWLKREGLWDSVSPKEKEFLENPNRPEKDAAIASWRAEALWVLLWAILKTDKLEYPAELCDTAIVQQIMPKPGDSISEFIQLSKLRSPAELLDAVDLIYRIHWAVVEAHLKKEPMPAALNPDVVYERHYVLNWPIGYAENWDDVTTDT